MLRVGVVGVGGISGAHIPTWEKMEETELVAICDIRPEQMEKYTDKIAAKHYTDCDEMLKNEHLDILDICLPTYLHADYAVKAMEQGINVLCEKPVSLKREDVRRVYDTAKKHNVRFMIAQVLRFWTEYEYIKEIYDSGKYGKLLSGVMTRIGQKPQWSWDGWYQDEKRSGLVPFDLHIHDLDFMVYAFGKPQGVDCFRSKLPDQDYIHAVYSYKDFFIATEAAWYASPHPFCLGFRFQFENAVVTYEGGKITLYPRDGQPVDLHAQDDAQSDVINLPKTDAYGNEIRYFTDCVLAGKDADKVKPEELETVLDFIAKLNEKK